MANVHKFTLGGTADTALGVVLLNDWSDQALPSTRDRYVEIPGRQGRVNFDSDLGPRELTLELEIIDGTTEASLQTLARALSAVLLDQDGHPQDVSLVFERESTKTYTVRYSGHMPIERLVGATHGRVSLPLIQADPFVYGASDTDSDSITASYQEMAIENAGDYRTPPTITVTNNGAGDVTGFTLVLRQIK